MIGPAACITKPVNGLVLAVTIAGASQPIALQWSGHAGAAQLRGGALYGLPRKIGVGGASL
ncbi:hypothetical protein [uncultured Parasphingorhabdus sp.]|uniref:hypothetical protein n=1 Tax=uncultured Parasphingorhabdus sp. TaxID=2709694 RepID=UPI0030D92F4E|tara:strand:+ start:17095 stop:17277 length:183 start_codon:yes stop_codon:yes gene_type:complete